MEIFNEMQKFLHTSINTFNLLSTWNKILSKIIFISENESLDCECVKEEYVDIQNVYIFIMLLFFNCRFIDARYVISTECN